MVENRYHRNIPVLFKAIFIQISAQGKIRLSVKAEENFLAKPSGGPNENIVQNHLNIAFLNVFEYLKVDIGIFLSLKFFHLFGFPR